MRFDFLRVLRAAGIALAAVAVLFAATLFSFLGATVHPFFWNGVLVLALTVAGVTLWAVWGSRQDSPDIEAQTRVLRLDEIAEHQPDLPRRRRVGIPASLRARCVRAARRVKEAAR